MVLVPQGTYRLARGRPNPGPNVSRNLHPFPPPAACGKNSPERGMPVGHGSNMETEKRDYPAGKPCGSGRDRPNADCEGVLQGFAGMVSRPLQGVGGCNSRLCMSIPFGLRQQPGGSLCVACL